MVSLDVLMLSVHFILVSIKERTLYYFSERVMDFVHHKFWQMPRGGL